MAITSNQDHEQYSKHYNQYLSFCMYTNQRGPGKRKFTLDDLGDGVYSLDLKKDEEVLLYSDNALPDLHIAPFPDQIEKRNRYGL